jgi:hypothetical protein
MVTVAPLLLLDARPAQASHSWSNYHWSRTSNPLVLRLGDSVNSSWDGYLHTASAMWNSPVGGFPPVVSTQVVYSGRDPRTCRPVSTRTEVCNATYGQVGWLGLAQIGISRGHIAHGVAKMNDTYFNQAQYNTPSWRQLVMCQEVAHTFGLGHQDENFNNANLGSCMDYTRAPDGGGTYGPSNVAPNAHDFQQLFTIYGGHLDLLAVASSLAAAESPSSARSGGNSPREWGIPTARDPDGFPNHYVRTHGNGDQTLTHVFWVRTNNSGQGVAPTVNAPRARGN